LTVSAPPHALLLAAGRGERMRPLTDHTPKPLLPLHGRPLIVWHLEALARAGVREVVVNTAWLEAQFPAALGDGARWGLRIRYSTEGRDHGGALETAGGMKKARRWLGEVFWTVSADVHAPDFDYGAPRVRDFLASGQWGRLWLVDNPAHHPGGDFGIRAALADRSALPRLTWSGIALFRAEFVDTLMADLAVGTPAPLRDTLDAAIARGVLGAERLPGRWADVGTPERLAALAAMPV
jgi:MurNAc alpha-1-phosphate uridylyltransferase